MARRLRMMSLAVATSVVLLTAGAAVAAPPQHGGATVQVVADGLQNPRGLAVLPGGTVLVAEAGSGGDGPCFTGEPDPGQPGHPPEFCYGPSSAVTAVVPALGTATRIITGLPSLALPDGTDATGLVDVSIGSSGLLGIIGGTGDLSDRDGLGKEGELMAHVVRFTLHGPRAFGDLGAFEEEHNPDGAEPYSNPYGLTATKHGAVAVDAGGNSLVQVDRHGAVSLLAVFPPELVPAPPFLGLPPGTQIPTEAVPVDVVQGPDGAYYVALFTGFPFAPGSAKIWRVMPGQQPTVYADGFTNVIGLDFDRHGGLWVVEHTTEGYLSGDPTGALIKVESDGSRTEVAPGALTSPGGVGVARDGSIYVTNHATSPDSGQVLRIRP